MIAEKFSHVGYWVFDLDNTLYAPNVRLFDQIDQRMTAYIMQNLGVDQGQASRLRYEYWREYGTTLAGLMRLHGVDPVPYMTWVHDIDFGALSPDPDARPDCKPARSADCLHQRLCLVCCPRAGSAGSIGVV